jgi:dephospho-CoA kinase
MLAIWKSKKKWTERHSEHSKRVDAATLILRIAITETRSTGEPLNHATKANKLTRSPLGEPRLFVPIRNPVFNPLGSPPKRDSSPGNRFWCKGSVPSPALLFEGARYYLRLEARLLGADREPMTFVFAFTGKIGSGKTALSTALAAELRCRRTSFGDYVRYITAARGLEQNRQNLQAVGTELLERDRIKFCNDVLRFGGWSPGEALVIDGLRHIETIEPIKQIVAPARLKILRIDIAEETRLMRLGIRGDGDATALRLAESHSSEQQVGSTLAGAADFVIDGSSTIELNVRNILEWAKTQ